MAQRSSSLPNASPNKKGKRWAVRLPEGGESDAVRIAVPNGQRRRGDDVRERILAAALECFAAFGFEGTSTRAVAAKAGLTHSLVLYHFESKDQLWLSTVEAAVEPFVRDVRSAFIGKEGPADQILRAFIAQFVRLSAERPEVNRIMTVEGGQDTERLRYVMDKYIRQNFIEICSLIRRGQDEGTVRECDPARLYFHIIAGSTAGFSKAAQYKELTGRDSFSEQEILRTIAFIYDVVFNSEPVRASASKERK